MNEILTTIITGVITAVVLPLLGFATNALIKWIQTKTKSEVASELLTTATNIVMNAVKAVFQTYVASLKKNNTFTAEAQAEALERAKNTALEQMSIDVKTYIKENYGDIDKWLTTMIESSINSLKRSNAE